MNRTIKVIRRSKIVISSEEVQEILKNYVLKKYEIADTIPGEMKILGDIKIDKLDERYEIIVEEIISTMG